MNFDFTNLLHFDSGSVEQHNIIDPLIKLCLYITPALFLFLWLGYGVIAVVILCLIIIFIIGCYFYCLLKMPERLQTEKELLESRRMEFQYNTKNGYNPSNYEELIEIAPEGTKLLPLTHDEEEKV